MWQTLFYKNGDAMSDFLPFPRDGVHKPTFCVWELVPVWHEQQAWERFLVSARDEAAAQTWLSDLFAAPPKTFVAVSRNLNGKSSNSLDWFCLENHCPSFKVYTVNQLCDFLKHSSMTCDGRRTLSE